MSPPADTGRRPRSPAWERALSLALRTIHLMAVMVLGALAVAFLVRRYVRVSKGKAPVCGNCNNCHCDD